MNINIDAVKTAIRAFNDISHTSREALEAKYQPVSRQMFDDFCDACGNDADLVKTTSEIKELEKVLEFDRTSCFQVRTGVINEDDFEFREVIYSYSSDYEQKARYAAENWPEIESKINQSIDRINNSKLVLFKNKKLNSLKSELNKQAGLRNTYLSAERQDKAKKDCINNGGIEKLEKLKKFVAQRKTEIAERIIESQIATTPAIICVKQVFEHLSSSRNGINVEGEVLNNIITNLRADLSERIIQEEVASI